MNDDEVSIIIIIKLFRSIFFPTPPIVLKIANLSIRSVLEKKILGEKKNARIYTR